jgi:ATP-dependent DNA helicase RecQ
LLPPNLGLVRDLLTQRGPLSPEDLATALRDNGVVLGPLRLAALPERFPNSFGRDEAGRLTIPAVRLSPDEADEANVASEDSDEARPAWWAVTLPRPIALDDLVVLVAGSPCEEQDAVRDLAAIRMCDDSGIYLPAGSEQTDALRQFADGVAGVVVYAVSASSSSPLVGLTVFCQASASISACWLSSMTPPVPRADSPSCVRRSGWPRRRVARPGARRRGVFAGTPGEG